MIKTLYAILAVLLAATAAAFLWRTPRALLTNSALASAEVLGALARGAPVLALESTIITHGMDYPENLHTARLLEALARESGVVPATIAVINGTPTIGIGPHLVGLARSASLPGSGILKASRLDLPYVRATRKTAGTTVALTAMLADAAGIHVFATGGIGGAHRVGPPATPAGSEGADGVPLDQITAPATYCPQTPDILDISADLLELARTPVLVVSAGPKAILDLPRTAEVLETNSVPVLGYKTDFLPAFWTSRSEVRLTTRVEDEREAALVAFRAFAQGTGALLANPIPAALELGAETVATAVDTILAELPAAGVRGKAVTPYMLRRMKELTGGRSVTANVALIENNVHVASGVARCLAYPETGLRGFVARMRRGIAGRGGLAGVWNGIRAAMAGALSEVFPSALPLAEFVRGSAAPAETDWECSPIPVYDTVIGALRNPVLLAVSRVASVPALGRHVDVLMWVARVQCIGILVRLGVKLAWRLCGTLSAPRKASRPVLAPSPSPAPSAGAGTPDKGPHGKKQRGGPSKRPSQAKE